MPNCPRCQKPVYFGMSSVYDHSQRSISTSFVAERVQSLGKDWHRPCLRCANDKCNKTLAPGSHSEHEGQPYCTQCYGAKFGPKGYGHGGTESHTFHGEQPGN
ncbi:unnamed protein product [Toxocara canis]|uniref:Cysteine-rich protein 1 n=1 Tax=Toxocara canis TaxID=6265 RepID=A0A183UFV9_TOXCA|nr:unnamed protein product [Toxocara canis]